MQFNFNHKNVGAISRPYWIQRILLIGACLVLSTQSLWAGKVYCGNKPFTVGFYEYGLYYDSNGKGIDKDIIDELKKRTGCPFEEMVLKRARIWSDLASGDLDIGMTGIQTEERDNFAWFANYLSMKNYAILRAGIADKVKRPEDFLALKDLQFGMLRSFKHGVIQDQIIDQLRAQQRVQESPDAESIFKKLKEQRVDAMFSQPTTYHKHLKELQMEKDVVIQDWTPSEKGTIHGLIMSKSRFSEVQFKQWKAVIDEMRADGTLKRIYQKYLPPADAQKMLDF
ncbi:MAG: transporter substrate-binding domain-containing protein [SAR324 cluster bacterium]|nr:transporter substrate-binding domain-containing protein [SAR324 cluster bacterium]